MDAWQVWGQLIETYLTSAAIVLGGIWVYKNYFRQRVRYPWLKTEIHVAPVKIDAGWILHINASLENTGEVRARVSKAELRLRQIVPLPYEIEEAVANGYDPVSEGESEIVWPMLAVRNWEAKEGGFEVEPKEVDAFCADFFVPTEVQSVELYFFAANEKKKKQNLGWSTTSVYNLPNMEE